MRPQRARFGTAKAVSAKVYSQFHRLSQFLKHNFENLKSPEGRRMRHYGGLEFHDSATNRPFDLTHRVDSRQ
jgi:hypothetical protein